MGEHHLSGPTEVDVREVELKAGAARLRALLAVPPSPCGWVIFAHEGGNSLHGSAHRSVARALNQAGLATLSMELLTAAEAVNRRKAFETPLLADRLMAGAEWLGMESGAGVGCFGAGEGAAAALWAASEKGSGIESLVACAPRLDLASDRLGEVKASTLLIVGGADRRALKQVRWARKRMGSSELIVVPGATRLFDAPAALRALADQSVEWFKRTVSSDAEVLETARAGLSRDTRRRLAAAASLLMLSGFIIGPKVVSAAVTAAFTSSSGLLDIAMTVDGDQVSVTGSAGGLVTVTSNLGDVAITGAPVNAADVASIRISNTLGGTGDPSSTSLPAGAQLADVSGVTSANGFTSSPSVIAGFGGANDTFYGSAFYDNVWGGNNDDLLIGNDGDDFLHGLGANDVLVGGAGNDTLDGSTSNDSLVGGDGNDFLTCGPGVDTALGGIGDDIIQDPIRDETTLALYDGGEGNDQLRLVPQETPLAAIAIELLSPTGPVRVSGGDVTVSSLDITPLSIERWWFEGAEYNDTLIASADTMGVYFNGDRGVDIMTGGFGNDTIVDEQGIDIVDGAGGADILVVGDNAAREQDTTGDTMGIGQVISLLGAGGPVHFKQLQDAVDGNIVATGFEAFQFDGCGGRDTLDGSADTAGIIINGNAGDDLIVGGSGNDSLTGGAGGDVMNGGAGDDTLRSDRGWDTLDGGVGTGDLVNIGETNVRQALNSLATLDTALAGQGILISLLAAGGPIAVRMAEVTNGTAGAQATVPVSNVERYTFTGNSFNSTVGTANDTLDGAAATAGISIAGNAGRDLITGGSGNDTLGGGDQADTITGNDGNDSLTGGESGDVMNGNAGDDTLRSDRGWDTLDGGAGTLDQLNIGETNVRQAIDTVGGQGVVISLVSAAGPVNVRMAEVNGGALTTMGTNLEQFVFNGSNYNDTTLTNTGDTLDGAADSLGILIFGNNGNDLVTGGSGNDTLNGNAQNDTVTASNGNDLINGGNENDNLNGGAGDDVYVFDQADTNRGIDTLADASGSDTADFSLDTLSADALFVRMGGSLDVVAGPSTVTTADMIENVIGGPLDDLFIVTPSTVAAQFADGGGGTANHLKYDGAAVSGAVTVTASGVDTVPSTISGAGVQDVTYLNFAQVDTLVISSARTWQMFE